MEAYNWKSVIDLLALGWLTPITIDVVSEITELESDTLNEQEMRVLDVTVDPVQFFARYNDFTTSILSGLAALRGNDSIDIDTFLEEMIAGMEIKYTIWVGVDDGLPHRTTYVIIANTRVPLSSLCSELQITQETTNSAIISDFNEPFEIEAPVIE